MTNKREHERSPIELAASFGIPEAQASERATVINISQGGFCFISRKKISVNSELRLSVEIDDGTTVDLDVICVWSRKGEEAGEYLHGVRITNIKGKDVGRFLDFNSQIFKSGS